MRCIILILMLMIFASQSRAQFLDPLEKATLDFYYDSKTNSIDGARLVDGSITTNKFAAMILDLWLPRDGSKAMQAALPMGGFRITNLGAPTVPTDAATKQYVDANAGGSTNYSFSSYITNSPTFTEDVLTKVEFKNMSHNYGSMFNGASNGWYTPLNGIYMFNINLATADDAKIEAFLYTNGTAFARNVANRKSPGDDGSSSWVVGPRYMDSNMLVQVYLIARDNNLDLLTGTTNNWFSGFLMR